MIWLWLAACMEVAPSGRPFDPVPDEPSAANASDLTDVEAPAAAAGSITDGFNFDAEDRPDAADAADTRPPSAEEAAAALGLAPLPPESAVPAESRVQAPAAAAPPPPSPTSLAPFPPPPQGWGVRLVSTVPGAQPPRAILGLADGTETVVTPGDLLPAAHLVVLAIGRDAVQVAEVTPVGDHAVVHTYVLGSLFPTGTAPGAAPQTP